MKRFFIFFLRVLPFILLQQSAFSIDEGSLLTAQKNASVRHPRQLQRLARVRLSIVLTNYKKFLVRNNYAKVREMYRPLKPLKHHLRARIEKPNHFYIDEWHIETMPVSWSKESMGLTMKLRFYRRYGNNSKLEELIGSTTIKGSLEGNNHLYSFMGSKNIKFSNLLGHPLLDVAIGAPKKPNSPLSVSGPATTAKSPAKGKL